MRTFTKTAPNVMQVFADVVSEVESNIITDPELSVYIPRVSYKCETFTELINRLTVEGQVDSLQESRYPLVSLIRNYELNWSGNECTADFTIIIVTPSVKDKLSEDREIEYYDRILRPIYSELMSVITDSSSFLNVSDPPDHRYAESFRFGDSTPNGNDGYIFPDNVDAVIVSGLKLSLNTDTCFGRILTPRVSVGYLNNLREMVGGLTDNGAYVTLRDVQYVNNRFNDADAIAYELYTEHNTTTIQVTEGQVCPIVKGGAAAGLYHGYFRGYDGKDFDSTLYFFYELDSTTVKRVTTYALNDIEGFTLSGIDDYPFNYTFRLMYQAPNIDSVEISHIGNSLYSQIFHDGTSDTGELSNRIDAQIGTLSSNPVPVDYTLEMSGEYINGTSYYLITN